jgi:hypothetical protein
MARQSVDVFEFVVLEHPEGDEAVKVVADGRLVAESEDVARTEAARKAPAEIPSTRLEVRVRRFC